MIVFSIASGIFILVVGFVLHAQRRNERRIHESAEAFNRTIGNVVPLVQKQHTLQFGRASTALESSFPGDTISPKTKSHPA